ncbi:MAG: flagellar biosynthesis protein FlhF [Candidatus Marinimicrobia bacterium]|nr:flagellar biosynthesis protein FlhF [Candidatus Neomarinimicrobiota bacterium]MCF7880518.1 flagellar biosynthesis protein FlhF [Candidatus Neomarinimicrobiota bacterium]
MMRIKKIQAETVQEALTKIRQEFGPEAVILHTRKLEANGAVDGQQVEVTAGIDSDGTISPKGQQAQPDARREEKPTPDETSEIREEMRQMQQIITKLTKELQYPDVQMLPDVYREWYMHLVAQEVDMPLLKELIRGARKSLGDDASHMDVRHHMDCAVDNIFSQSIPQEAGQGQRRIAIIGPTGVGKTTTIAKLATQKTIEEGRTVALITADTFRVAATDQLRVFADLIDVPLEIVYTPIEMREAIRKFDDYDYIYVDTTGRSQHDHESLSVMRRLVRAAQPEEVHLMLSATTSSATILAAAERFSIFDITDLIISKIDEAETMGTVLTMLHQHGWPVSYFTNGQNVPEDVVLGNATLYSERLFGEMG